MFEIVKLLTTIAISFVCVLILTIATFRAHGVRPTLTLQTKDGAILSNTDKINIVLGADERELEGIVVDFDLPPLVERYNTACENASVGKPASTYTY